MPLYYPARGFRTNQTLLDTLAERSRVRPAIKNNLPTGSFRIETTVGGGGAQSGGTNDPLDPGNPGLPNISWLQQRFTLTHNNANTGVWTIGDDTLITGCVFFWSALRGTTIRAQGTGSAGFVGATPNNSWTQHWEAGGSIGITGGSVAAILSGGLLKLTIPVDPSSTDDIVFSVKYAIYEV